MKRLEKLAVALIILWIVQWTVGSLMPNGINRIIHDNNSTESLKSAQLALMGVYVFVTSIPNIICGIWLYLEAKREKQSKWIWCATGFIFRIPAVMIFLAYVILKELREKIRT